MNNEYQILKKINYPKDLKRLDLKELNTLALEIRTFLIKSISETGGHLASNLGVVELTIALHRCFNTPEDKIIWDVGHQCYVHKILTGRKNSFPTLRKMGGMSGFPKSSESPYDVFNTGHSSTSISAALGIAVARDLEHRHFKVISVIGDGSMTGGLAYEGLNNAGIKNTNLIVILNDNEMSISKNVGAISKHLNDIRTSQRYLLAKAGVKDFLGKIPAIGVPVKKLLDTTKSHIKNVLVKGGIFRDLGFNYIGPLDGHDLPQLIKVLSKVKGMKGPVLVHVYTKKGKGYDKAEYSPDNYHGISSFNIQTGIQYADKTAISYSDIFGKKLFNMAKNNEKIVAVTAAMPDGTGLKPFSKKYPDRFFDVGIAESHAVTFCAGLAKQGMIPFFAVYSTFLQRGYDQILHDVCLQNLRVVFAIDRAGIVGADGETHQGIYDISYLMHIPNMTVMCPKNRRELEDMLTLSLEISGPCAIRYPREKPTDIFDSTEKKEYLPIEFNKAEIITDNDNPEIALVSLGTMTEYALKAYLRLKKEGINIALVNARFAKPIPENLLKYLEKFKYIFTIEDNCITGGFGEKLISELSKTKKPFTYNMGFPDKFIEHGSRSEIFKLYQLDDDGIYNKIKENYGDLKEAGPDNNGD